MSYCQALEAAGAKILQFKEFGSYQGDWWAKVDVNGEIGWIAGSYGSCSGCDAFEAEFGYGVEFCDDHKWIYDESVTNTCSDCQEVKEQYQIRLADFGKVYLDTLYTHEEAVKEASRYIDWDFHAPEMVEWITENK